jgi:hypothetical protein
MLTKVGGRKVDDDQLNNRRKSADQTLDEESAKEKRNLS